jgi:hypothetical protein
MYSDLCSSPRAVNNWNMVTGHSVGMEDTKMGLYIVSKSTCTLLPVFAFLFSTRGVGNGSILRVAGLHALMSILNGTVLTACP